MADFRWIQVCLFVIAALQFTAAAGFFSSFFTVRAGQEVTLPCENVIDDQQNCDRTTWTFNQKQSETVELITLGQIVEESKSDRLSVTQNCSLVIKKVTDEDAGRYDCQQWKSGQGQTLDSQSVVYLSVVSMTEHRISDQVTLNCSVRSYERWCEYTVMWLYDGNNVDKDDKDLQTSQSVCSASVTFKTSHFIQTSNSDLLKCEVTDRYRVQRFPFSLQPSGEKPGDDTTKPEPEPKPRPPPRKPGPEPKTRPPPTKPGPEPKTRPPPTKPGPEPKPRPPPRKPGPGPKTRPPPTTASSMKRGTIMTVSAINDDSANLRGWWRFIIVSLGLAALIVIVVAVSMWTRTKGRKTQMDENVVDDDEDDGAVNYENVTSSV